MIIRVRMSLFKDFWEVSPYCIIIVLTRLKQPGSKKKIEGSVTATTRLSTYPKNGVQKLIIILIN